MELFDVYPVYNIEPVKALGSYIWDKNDTKYLDLYGGHAVISIGHSHPKYIQRINEQLSKIGFYSNSIQNSLQKELAQKLGQISGYTDFSLFLCNSGAEANENALKVASFHTGKDKVIAFKRGFHGRTSGAVAVTDNQKIQAPINKHHQVLICDLNDLDGVEKNLKSGEIAAVIIEGIQGLAGGFVPDPAFMKALRSLCTKHHAILILDEVQSGYGRSGKFFAHQHFGIEADIITVAKGMGNGFPIGGVLIHPDIKPWHGMLGTTFGGNHLACAAGIAVLEVIEEEKLVDHVDQMGSFVKEQFEEINAVQSIRGKGLLLGLQFAENVAPLRKELIYKHHIFTGGSAEPTTLRILPPLNIQAQDILKFKEALTHCFSSTQTVSPS